MIITKEMYDEFVESAENHSILWTDTLALIGVTVGDVPDVIEAQADEIARTDLLLRASVPEPFKQATSPVGAVQSYIAQLEAANQTLRLGLYGLIDSHDADDVAKALEAGAEIDWNRYPESVRKALEPKP
jgi:hypothetical protein